MIAVAKKQYPDLDNDQRALLEGHAGLPSRIAAWIIRQNPWLPESLVDFEDLANRALLEAVLRFKPERGYKFTNFATVVIQRRVRSQAYAALRGSRRIASERLDDCIEPLPPDHSAIFEALVEALDDLPSDQRAAVVAYFGIERSGHSRATSERLRRAEERLVEKAIATLKERFGDKG